MLDRAKWLAAAAVGGLACAVVIGACGFDGEGTRDDAAAREDAADDGAFAKLDARETGATDAPPLDGGDGGPCAADLSTSAEHCGRCNHSCLGGTCASSQCQPVTLATRSRPYDLALDATNVYWTDKGGGALLPDVSTVPKAGGMVRLVSQASSASGDPTALVIAGTGRMVFTDLQNDLILSCAKAGTACQDEKQLTSESGANGVAWNGTSVYWANSSSGNIRRADALLQNDVIFVSSRNTPRRIVANAANVFWTVSGGIETVPVTGGGVSQYSGDATPRDLAIDATYIYVVTQTEVRRLTHGGQNEIVLATGTDLQRVAVDGSGVYYTDRGGGGRVLRCPLAGCIAPKAPDVLATGDAAVLAIAVDATRVFWTNELPTNGTVRTVAK